MLRLLPFGPNTLRQRGLLFTLLTLLLALPALAQAQTPQCPAATACRPGNAPAANLPFGFGIVQVTLGNLSSTSAVRDGYQDYSCLRQATLVVGRSSPLSIQTSSAGPENVRVYLDYNNDGAFTGAGELVFSSDNRTQHTGSFTPPAGAVLGQPLRLRVAADYADVVPPPTACATSQYSQTEDYAVVLTANTLAPAAAFSPDVTLTCTGSVQLRDQSQNLPTSWRWDFGDGNSSSEQNPRYCYAAPGTYAVRLTATNAAGSSTSAPVSITYDNRVPVAATCAPATTAYCCNYGIVKFELGSISHASADGSAGYQDFTCAQRTELFVDETYPLRISTGGTLAHATQAYLDFNNDGAFTANELILNAPEARNPSTTLRVPAAGARLGQPLRLRLITDFVGATLTPCGPRMNGQVEDYTVILRVNDQPPVVDFSSSYGPGSCGGFVQFNDLSRGVPTAWRWDFGDGNSSTQQNPSHVYAGPGPYTVRLSVTNAVGTTTLSRPNFLPLLPACLSYCAANGSGRNPGTASNFWIVRVALETSAGAVLFGNSSGLEPGGYGNYTSRPISVAAGSSYVLRVESSISVMHRVMAWADFNRDGAFATTELLTSGLTVGGGGRNPAVYTATVGLPATLPAGPIRLRVLTLTDNQLLPGPCTSNIFNAEVEDYALLAPVLSAGQAPARAALPGLRLYPTPTPAGQLLRLALADAPAAGRYALSVENMLGARLLSASRRLGPTAEATLDISALPPGVYVLRLRDEQGREALRRIVRE